MYMKALRCCLTPGSQESSLKEILCANILLVLQSQGHQGEGERGREVGKNRDKYRAGYSFTKQHSPLLRHTGSLQKDYMESWHLDQSMRRRKRESCVCWFLPVSCLSLVKLHPRDLKAHLRFQVVLSTSSGQPLGKPSPMPMTWCFL